MDLIHNRTFVECGHLFAPAWDGEDLIDVQTHQRIFSYGTFTGSAFSMGYPFNRGLCVRDAGVLWTLAYENRGTKALLLKDGKVHRELNRSYNFAKEFDYPIALAVSSSGRAVVVHCPNSYTELECEDAETGETLWKKSTTNMEFHSRLSVSEDSGFLLSAGWFWHPVNGAWVSPFNRQNPTEDKKQDEVSFSFGAEIDGAAFLGRERVVITTTEELIDSEVPPTGLPPMTIGVWSIPENRWISTAPLAEKTGTILPWREWAISFYKHPKAIELATGRIAHVWDDLDSGSQVGSIDLGEPPPPAMALDPRLGKFAIAGAKGITIISLG
jgi:hypothetical protein